MIKNHSLKLLSDQRETELQIESSSSDTENSSHKSDGKLAKESNRNFYLRYVSLLVLIVQNTALVLLMSYASQRKQPKFLKTVAVFYNEVLKLIAATILFVVSTGSLKESFRLFKQHFITEWFDTLKVGVPAIIYTIQNFLVYIAIDHLDAATYLVTCQLKILTTALFTVLMLKRRLSAAQCISLCVLIGGVALVQINAGTSGKDKMASTTSTANSSSMTPEYEIVRNPWIGFIAVLLACIMSGFAGVYFEKILKSSDVSLWLRSTQLTLLALPISLIIVGIQDYDRVIEGGFMQGFDFVVWSIVSVQAFGGLVVAVVVKYADNILKGFATSISIVLSAIASIILFSIIPQTLFIAGAGLVIFSVVVYSMFPYKESTTAGNKTD